MKTEKFVAHGTYQVSNSGGYEIMLSNDGESARVRDCFGSDNPKTSDWLEIETIKNEDYVVGEDEEDYEFIQVIDPAGYNIPLNEVMRIDYEK